MQTINSQTDLRNAILELESRQALEGLLLKEQFLVAYESIKPINLIKNTFKEAADSHDFQDSMLNATIGLTTGYLSKILFQGISTSPVKKFLGTAVMFGIKNLVAQNPEVVKSVGHQLFKILKNVLMTKEKDKDQTENYGPAAS